MSVAKSPGFTIRMFVPDGDPDGTRVVGKSNWTGVGVVFKRTDIRAALARPEAARTGVYILVGNTEGQTLPDIYVGEGDPVFHRLKSHASEGQAGKDYWTWAVYFVSKDNALNKAHVQRMECKLIEVARQAKRCHLHNGTTPTEPTLTEEETVDVDNFLVDVLSILPLVGITAFDPVRTLSKPALPFPGPLPEQRAIYRIESKGVRAEGYEDTKGFVLVAGSTCSVDETPTLPDSIRTLRQELLRSGVLVDEGDRLRLTQDYAFSSPWAAGAVVVAARGANRSLWKADDGRTLAQVQAAAIQSSEP